MDSLIKYFFNFLLSMYFGIYYLKAAKKGWKVVVWRAFKGSVNVGFGGLILGKMLKFLRILFLGEL